jgi:4-hydroxybenzoate polyprenyltransferase
VKALTSLFWSSRPVSWVNTAFPFFAAYLFVAERIDLTLILGTLFFLIPYNFLMYGINDVFDYESDLRNPRKGGIEGALLDPKYHAITIWASVGISSVFVVYLLLAGSLEANLWLGFTLAAVLAYSIPKLRFKERPFLDSFTSAVHFVGPMVYGLVLAGSEVSDPSVIAVIAAFMGWGMASHAFGAVQDVRADREAGIKSVATQIGARNTVRFAFVLYILSAAVVMTIGWHGVVASLAVLPYLLIISPYLNITDADCERANGGWKRFIWLNFAAGALISLVVINYFQAN